LKYIKVTIVIRVNYFAKGVGDTNKCILLLFNLPY